MIAARAALLAAPPTLVAAVGMITVVAPPPSVATTWTVLVVAWSTAMIVGGLLTLYALFVRRSRHTMAGQALIAGGCGFYALQLLTTPDGLSAAGLIGASALGSLGEVYRHLDMARWRRADRNRAEQRHPAGG